MFLDQIARSPRAARVLIRLLSLRLRETDDRVVNEEVQNSRVHENRANAGRRKIRLSFGNAYLAAKSPWLERQFHTPLCLGDLPFVIELIRPLLPSAGARSAAFSVSIMASPPTAPSGLRGSSRKPSATPEGPLG